MKNKETKKLYTVVLLVGIIIICFCVLILYENYGVPRKDEYTVEISDGFLEVLNTEYSGFSSGEEFIDEVKYYIEAISEFVSVNDWYNVYKEKHGDYYICNISFFTTKTASHVEGGYGSAYVLIPNVYINNELLEYHLAPIAHEITHIMFPSSGSLSLREGLACYMQDTFGKNPSIFNMGIEIQTYANYILLYSNDIFNELFSIIGTEKIQENKYTQGIYRKYFYNLSYSFTKYLIDEYGIELFMNLYNSTDLMNDYERIFGKSFEKLKDNWKQFLELYDEPLSPDDIQKYIDELYVKHNII